MIVTSKNTISFPQYGWGIHANEKRELPSDKKAQEVILANEYIEKVEESKSRSRRVATQKADEKTV